MKNQIGTKVIKIYSSFFKLKIFQVTSVLLLIQ